MRLRHACLALLLGACEAPADDPTPPPAKKVPVSKSLDGVSPDGAAAPADSNPVQKGVTNENLTRFLPAEIRGARRKLMDDSRFGGPKQDGFVAASYMLDDDKGRRFVNINLQKVVDLAFEKAQFQVGDGETRESAHDKLLGKTMGGRLVQRRYSLSMKSSEVIVLVGDQISVRASVEKAGDDEDEAFEVLELMDLDGLEKIIP